MYTTTAEITIYIIVFSSILILFLSIFIILVVSVYNKKQNIYINEIRALKTLHENEILKAQIEIQEQTFQNISRDIHDNVGQKLALAKLQIINLSHSNQSQIIETADIISAAIGDLRNLSRMLNSDIIKGNGLIRAIENETQRLEKTNIFSVKFEVDGEVIFLSEKRELILFRIMQEALQNVVKHAQASRVSILLEYGTQNLRINISDNGNGFLLAENDGQGLTNMKARAKLLGGVCEVIGVYQKGTTVKIETPVYEPETTN